MSTHDPISDLITRIRNAQMRAKPKVSTPGSKMRANVLEVLKAEGYIRGYASVEHASGRSELEIELKYFDGEPVIREIERVSKPGRRVYASVKNLPRVNNGLGISVLSTPKGIMADHAAREGRKPGRGRHQGFREEARDHRRRLPGRDAGQEPAACTRLQPRRGLSDPGGHHRHGAEANRDHHHRQQLPARRPGRSRDPQLSPAGALQGQGCEICRRIHLPQGRQEEVTEPVMSRAKVT